MARDDDTGYLADNDVEDDMEEGDNFTGGQDAGSDGMSGTDSQQGSLDDQDEQGDA